MLASYGLLLLLFLLLVVAWESAKSYNPDILDHIATPCQGEREEAELGQGKSDHSSAHSIDYETHPWKQVKIEMESTVDHQGDGRIQTAKYGGY